MNGVAQGDLVAVTKRTVILSEYGERRIPAFVKQKYGDSSLRSE